VQLNNENKNFFILIIEHDFSFGLELTERIQESGSKLAGCIHEPSQAFDIVRNRPPDLVIMGILGDSYNRIEVARQLDVYEIPVLFISHLDHTMDYQTAKQLRNFMGYLNPPLFKYTILTCLDLIKNLLEKKAKIINNEKYIYFKNNEEVQKILKESIFYIEVQKGICFVNLNRKKISILKPLSYFEKMLPTTSFLRVHRNYIVNLRRITSIDFTNLTVYFGERQIPISRRNKKLLQSIVNNQTWSKKLSN